MQLHDPMRGDRMARYESDWPDYWVEKSLVSLMIDWGELAEYCRGQLARLGCPTPVPVRGLGDILESLGQFTAPDAKVNCCFRDPEWVYWCMFTDKTKARGIPYVKPGGKVWWVLFNPESAPIELVRVSDAINRMAHATFCEPSDAAMWLLADVGIVLPYIVIERGKGDSFGQSATVHVADIEAQAEEVRGAWVEMLDVYFGNRTKRRPAQGAYAIIRHDARASARLGSTWSSRQRSWNKEAAVLGFQSYEGEWSQRAYMNRVKSLKKDYPALLRLWNVELQSALKAQELAERGGDTK